MAKEEAEQPMNPQEAELLKYLEDLQASNPAEYEMLVSQLQSRDGRNNDGAPKGGEKVVPEPGFVAKTRSFTRQGTKVFINICHSEHVDPPGAVEPAPGSSGDELPLRIPLSLGPPREDLDKDGGVCTCYDVVFHPTTVESSLSDEDFRNLMLQLTLHQIKQKHGDDLSDDLSFPKIKGNYKGIAPLPQFMRKRGEPAAPHETAAADAHGQPDPAAGGSTSRKPLVEELDVAHGHEHLLPAPAYAVEPRKWRDGAAERLRDCAEDSPELGGSGGGIDCLSVKLHLPEVEDTDQISVELTPDELRLFVPAKYRVTVLLPQQVELRPLCSRYETRRHILNVALRSLVDNSTALDDTPAAPSETEEHRRAREARVRARRRLARAKADKAAAEKADTEEVAAGSAELDMGEGVVAQTAGGEAAAAGGRAGGEEAAGVGSAGAGAEADTGPPPSLLPGPLILSNSIAAELED